MEMKIDMMQKMKKMKKMKKLMKTKIYMKMKMEMKMKMKMNISGDKSYLVIQLREVVKKNPNILRSG